MVSRSNCKMKSRLDTNISSGQEAKKTFGCEICGKHFTTKTKLARHISAIHEGKKPFKCDICDYTCAIKSNMNQHVASVHEKRSHLNVTFVIIAVIKKVK